MAAANSIARWLFNEASSGTSPTTVADDTGNGNALTIDYSSGDASWTSVAAGSGLNFLTAPATTDSAKLSIADIVSTGNIGSSLSGATEFSFLITGDFSTPSSLPSMMLRIGPPDGDGSEMLFFTLESDRSVVLRINTPTGPRTAFFLGYIGTGVRTLAVVLETSGVGGAYARVYDNGTALTPNYSEIGQGDVLQTFTNETLVIGNRYSADRNVSGPIYYAELFTGVLTPTQISDASTALASNNDVNWSAPPVLDFVGSPTIDEITGTSFRVNVTTTLASTADILITSAGSSQPSDAAFDAATYGGSTTSYAVFRQTVTTLSPTTDYRVWIRIEDQDTTKYASVDATTASLASTILSVNGAQPIRYGQTGIVVIWESGGTGTTETVINGVTQANHSVISDTETRFDLVWPATMYGQTETLTIGSETITTPQFIPAVGYSYVTLSGYNPAATTGEVETSPAAVNGDQLVWNTESGTINIQANGIPVFTQTFDGTMSVAVVDQSDGSHSSFATITYDPPADIVPDQFDLGANVTGAATNTAVTRSFTVAGVTSGVDISFVATGAAQVSTNGTNFFSSVNAQLGGTVYVRIISSANYNTTLTGGVSANGIADSFSVTTRAAVAPTITTQPTNQTVSAGDNATFTVSATNVATYQWYEETGTTDTLISGATSSSYVRSTVLADSGKQFYCRLTSSEGGVTNSNTVTLTVNAANATLTSDVMRYATTKVVRANENNIPVRVRNTGGTIVYTGTVNTNGSGIFTITNNQMGSPGETVSVEFPDSGTNSYSGFTTTLT